MSKVTRVELYHVEAPTPAPFRPSWIPGYRQTANSFTLLRVTTADGRVGHAAGAAFDREREGLGSVLAPYVIGVDHADLDAVHQRLTELSYLGWRNFWIEGAFWDLVGQERGEPLWKLWGGASPEVAVYASTGEHRSVTDTAARAKALADRGFSLVKLRVHADTLEEDVAAVRAAREAVGPAVGLAVDADQAWRVTLMSDGPRWDVERAAAFAKAVEPLGVAWIEGALDLTAYRELAELRKRTSIPVAGGELNAGWRDLHVALDYGSYGLYQPDATFSGVRDVRRVAEAAAREGLAFTPHTWTNGFGLLLNGHLHAALATPGTLLEYPVDPPGWTETVRDAVLARPILADKGRIRLPTTPGLGAAIDERALRRYGRRFHDGTEPKVAWNLLRRKGLRETIRIARDLRARRERGG